jgi:hypothetical protein
VTLDVGGDPGDYVTGGVTYHVTSADASVSARGSFLPGLAVLSGLQVFASAELDGVGHFWDILLGAPSGTPLAPGTYEGTARFPSTDMPLLDVGGDGRGCNTATGSFDLDDVAVSRYGAVDRLAVSFEQHCEGGVPALRGSLSFARRIRYGLTCLDQDGDGEPDPTDRCPGTPSGVPVDDAGCSHDQFCTMIDVSADHGVRCAHADWRGDSPRHRDCIVTADGCRARP